MRQELTGDLFEVDFQVQQWLLLLNEYYDSEDWMLADLFENSISSRTSYTALHDLIST